MNDIDLKTVEETQAKILEGQVEKAREELDKREPHPEYKPVINEETIVLTHPDERLRQICEAVPEEHLGEQFLEDFIVRMKFIMIASKGIGLAAPQIGVTKRVFVAQNPETGVSKAYINPKITVLDDKFFNFKEGCLSLPNVFAVVRRPKNIRIEYVNEKGEACVEEASDLMATILQHEYDHLDGIEFFDKAGKFAKKKAIDKMGQKLSKLTRMNNSSKK